MSRPIIRTDNGKAALTLSDFNKHLGQLEVDFIDNVNIKNYIYVRKVYILTLCAPIPDEERKLT